MSGFLELAFGLPTLLFTLPLMAAVAYWLFAMVGVLDIEILDASEGLFEGAVEGIDGALDGVDAALDGAEVAAGSDPLDAQDVP